MNKVINVFSGVVLAIYCALVMTLAYDLSISSMINLKGLPYKFEICTGFALLVFLLGALRIKRKWQGASDMRQFKNFVFARPVSRSSLNLSLVYSGAEIIFMGFLLFFLYLISMLTYDFVIVMVGVILILLSEALYFAFRIIKGGDSFRIGINKSAVAYFNREMHIFYFTGLKRIELHQDMINFQYKEDLNLLLPIEVIRKEDRIAFRDALIEVLNERSATKTGRLIYIDDAFRTLE